MKDIAVEKVVYVDESGMNDNDFYPYAYSAKDERYFSYEPSHYKKRLSMIAGLCDKAIQAAFILEGHCHTQAFELYVEKILCPTLRPGLVVVIDNATFHKSLRVRELIEGVGCQRVYLPAYSPDLNPIEHYWHKLKTKIRKRLRDTSDSLLDAMKIVLKEVAIC
jgi:transposase